MLEADMMADVCEYASKLLLAELANKLVVKEKFLNCFFGDQCFSSKRLIFLFQHFIPHTHVLRHLRCKIMKNILLEQHGTDKNFPNKCN